jgi:hypothetical protein
MSMARTVNRCGKYNKNLCFSPEKNCWTDYHTKSWAELGIDKVMEEELKKEDHGDDQDSVDECYV